jgi:hypothetical protein
MADVFLALAVDLTTAEDLFSRIVKTKLATAWKGAKFIQAPETTVPCWVIQHSLVLHTALKPGVADTLIADAVALIEGFAKLSHSHFEDAVLLVGATIVKIHKIGDNTFNFSIRVSYTVGCHNPDSAMAIVRTRG